MTHLKSQTAQRLSQLETERTFMALFDYGMTFFIGMVVGIFGTSLLHWWVG